MSISPSEKIKVSIDGNIATLVIDNPSANTWDRESLPALKQVVEALNAEPTVYALVLTGAGEKFFSAGADLNQFASGDADVARAVGDAFGEAFETLADFRGVSIAAINGFRTSGSNLGGSLGRYVFHRYFELIALTSKLPMLLTFHPGRTIIGCTRTSEFV